MCGGSAQGDDEWLTAACPQFLCCGLHRRRTLFTGRDVSNIRAKQTIEQCIRRGLVLRFSIRNQNALQPESRSDRRCGARVVRLHATGRDQRVRTVRQRLRRYDVELADLVAAKPKWNRIVALDEERRGGAKCLAQARKLLDDGSVGGHRDASIRGVGVISSELVEKLKAPARVIAAELRPPRAELEAAASMDAWIDTYHAVRGLTRDGTFVFLTDSAVGLKEEDNLRHLVINLGSDVPRSRVVPFLTCKHSADYCLAYADRAKHHGFESLVVLGGDKHVGPVRCVEHAWQLREMIRAREDHLALGGWANPHASAATQVQHLLEDRVTAEFYLTQIVSHHTRPAVERFLAEAARRKLDLPGMFGVFYYRSANPKTLATLSQFLPVPVEELRREFADGGTPDSVCARSIRELAASGVRHFYVSNLPVSRAAATLTRILNLV